MSMSQDESNRMTELQARVLELEKKLEFVMSHLQLKYLDAAAADPATAAVLDWLRKGNQIESIMTFRLATTPSLA